MCEKTSTNYEIIGAMYLNKNNSPGCNTLKLVEAEGRQKFTSDKDEIEQRVSNQPLSVTPT